MIRCKSARAYLIKKLYIVIVFIMFPALSFAQAKAKPLPSLQAKSGKLVYNADTKGNRVLDYSYCGYQSSETTIPNVQARVFVKPTIGDNSAQIQRAIDYVSSLPLNRDGFRGAVLLQNGTYELHQPIRIAASGVVLRGQGTDKTTLLKRGVQREALLKVEGRNDIQLIDTVNITSDYVPVNARTFTVANGAKFHIGDKVIVQRPSTIEWIKSLNCDIFGGCNSTLGWKAGDTDIHWFRTILAVNGNEVTIDAPLTMALDSNDGRAQLVLCRWNGIIQNSGVENLALESDFDTKYIKDEDHCWTGISVDNAHNCWVRLAKFRHFAGSAVILQPHAMRVTVEDCISVHPISEIGGMRRTTFHTLGQLNLFQRCYSENGIHDFSAGFCAAGPNAFVQCDSYESSSFSGSIDSWACGLLFDIVNVDGDNISLKNLGQSKNGAGWSSANSLLWQCTAAELECFSPDTVNKNRAFGCWGQFSGNGEWVECNNHVSPRSLFYAQLAERLGREADINQSRILPRNTSASSSPTVEVAMQLAHDALTIPRLTLKTWIEQTQIDAQWLSCNKLKEISNVNFNQLNAKAENRPYSYSVSNGIIVANGMAVVGSKYDCPWWNGRLRTSSLAKAKPAITRFVPNRSGLGLTDCLDSVVNHMKINNIAAYDQNYGLWYDRRRDDHERIRRANGDVWAPFYEQPFARSGEQKAWDGLSRYDLTRPNKWYDYRLRAFANKASQQGKLLYIEHYFQHNILEAGAHWVDSPWRPVNNINNTQFPEPVPFAGDKRVFMAEYFYDTTNVVQRELHRQYIRHQLDTYADCPNIIHYISAEYTGPLHFVQFWLDTIAEWEAETGKKVVVALATTKDVQDAVLADAARAAVVDIIDIRYWHYKIDGEYTPKGGVNLAPRQHARKMKVGKLGFDEVYRAVSEYRQKYPEKAVTFYAQNYTDFAWAVFMAGGSCAAIPVHNEDFLREAATMKTINLSTENDCKMVKTDNGSIIFYQSLKNVSFDIEAGTYSIDFVDMQTGEIVNVCNNLNINGTLEMNVDRYKKGVYRIYR